MNKEQQIDELEQLITHIFMDACFTNLDRAEMLKYMAHSLYKEGYRKHSEIEWVFDFEWKGNIFYKCPLCNMTNSSNKENFCPHCGARMKAGE